ncbi:P-loop containing nucleoside triphosphate hydrolase protein [Amylocystis lapponica]|nr:P-loop containing nucleoside triphosphate hydrolase protein [Amylocystis lapponica]
MADPPLGSRDWLCSLLQQKCEISSPHPFQLDHGMDLIAGKDVFLVIAPGMGKTTVLHAPLLAAQARGERGIAIIIVPTKLLGVQQAKVASARGLRALAINEDTVHDAYYEEPSRNLFSELSSGKDIRIGIMSPQMLQSEAMQNLVRDPQVKMQIRWFFVDEVHLLHELKWQVAYQVIKYMRARLLSSTIWAEITGTATPPRARAIALDLSFRPGLYVDARYSVDRRNLKIVPRFIKHSVSSHVFLDLAFLIPYGLSTAAQIPTTLVFCETIELGWRVMTFLDYLIPHSVPNRRQIVQLYNSLMPAEYRAHFMEDIEDGSVLRIGICTDTCTYGLDISNVCRVVLFGLAPSVDSLKQRMHRGGRDGAPAVAYILAPSWLREQQKEDALRRAKLPPEMLRWYNATPNLCPRHADLLDNAEPFVLPEACCILHHPEPEHSVDLALIARWKEHLEESAEENAGRKPKIPRSDGTYQLLEKSMKVALTRMLVQWQGRVWVSIRGSRRHLPSEFFLPAHLISRLTEKAHICSSLERLRLVLPDWKYLHCHAEELFVFMTEVLCGFQEIIATRIIDVDDSDTDLDEGLHVEKPGPRRVRLLVREVHTNSQESSMLFTHIVTAKREQQDADRKPTKRQRRGLNDEDKENNSQGL